MKTAVSDGMAAATHQTVLRHNPIRHNGDKQRAHVAWWFQSSDIIIDCVVQK